MHRILLAELERLLQFMSCF